jgi:hypothetical protein
MKAYPIIKKLHMAQATHENCVSFVKPHCLIQDDREPEVFTSEIKYNVVLQAKGDNQIIVDENYRAYYWADENGKDHFGWTDQYDTPYPSMSNPLFDDEGEFLVYGFSEMEVFTS